MASIVTIGAKDDSLTPTPPPFPVRRFSVEEYQQMAQAGILTDEDKVELLEGWITPKMIHNPPHDLAVGLVEEAIRNRLTDVWKIRTQSAITTDDSRPEPDVAVVEGPLRRYAHQQPKPDEIALLVEVADTSLDRDRSKCQLYARAGIAAYWIVNLVDRQVEVYTHPSGPDSPHYAQQAVYKPGDSVPLTIAGQQPSSIAVDALLP
jgi:Uma2 family endonuclease